MAKGTLLTNFVDDILNATMNGKRRYKLIPNDDGTYSLEDVTTYDQIGTDFGAAVVNAIANAVNESADKNKIIDDIDTINGLTEEGYIAGGLALKNVTNSLTNVLNDIYRNCTDYYYAYTSPHAGDYVVLQIPFLNADKYTINIKSLPVWGTDTDLISLQHEIYLQSCTGFLVKIYTTDSALGNRYLRCVFDAISNNYL